MTLFSAVFTVSLSALAFEVLLARYFSITQFNHLSFMVISIALLGFAAGGTYLCLRTGRAGSGDGGALNPDTRLRNAATGYVLSAVGSFGAVCRIPLDYFSLPVEAVQLVYLPAVYLLLTLPFFFAGLTVTIAYTAFPEKTGPIYLATMTGSAVGAALPALVLPFVGEGRLAVLMALVPLVVLAVPTRPQTLPRRPPGDGNPERVRIPWAGVAAVLAAAALMLSPRTSPEPSAYKSMSQALRFPDTRVVKTQTGLTGRIQEVAGPYLRSAPGLSLQYHGVPPMQKTVYTDGENGLALYDLYQPDHLNFSRFSLPFAGYALRPDAESALVIQQGGGSAIPAALAAGIKDLTVVTAQARIAGILGRHYRMEVIPENPRGFLARSVKRFDVIQVERWGATPSAAAALDQEYLLTVQAFGQYLNHLTENGVVVVSRRLCLPPSDSVRIWATAHQALLQAGSREPERHMAMIRNWDVWVLLVSRRPIDRAGLVADFARRMNFDVVWLPDMTPGQANRFNRYPEAYHHEAINRLAAALRDNTAQNYFRDYLLDVRPQTDDRPFPCKFLKWKRVKDLHAGMGGRLYAMMLSGEIVVAAVFVQALVLSAILLAVPFAAAGSRGGRLDLERLLFFLAVGVGFMFLELFFIKAYTFLFGNPVVSFAVVVSGMLVCSGVGGYLSRNAGLRSLGIGLVFLIAAQVVLLAVHKPVSAYLIGLPETLRYPLALILMAPAGILAGLPFPLGMRHMPGGAVPRAYAWSVNGCASVLAAVIAVQIALSFGISWILVGATACYLAALACTRRWRTGEPASGTD